MDVGIVTFTDYVTYNEWFDYYIIGTLALIIFVGVLFNSILNRSQKALAHCWKLKEKGKEDKWNTKRYITNSKDIYDYCIWVDRGDTEIAKKIKDPMYAFYYCRNIRMDLDVAKNIRGIYYHDFIRLIDKPGCLLIFTKETVES